MADTDETLHVSVEWTGEKTEAGRMPTVQYRVQMGGRTVVSHPVGIAAVPATLAESLRRALGHERTDELQSLIDRIEQSPVL